MADNCMVEKGDNLYCKVCDEVVGSSGAKKAEKQHLKSKTHKMNLRGRGKKKEKDERKAKNDRQKSVGGCPLCSLLRHHDKYHPKNPEFDGEPGSEDESGAEEEGSVPCIPPRLFVDSPELEKTTKMMNGAGRAPFLTIESASLADDPSSLEEVIRLCCHSGNEVPTNKGAAVDGNGVLLTKPLPNIDIEGKKVEVKSWSKAKAILSEAEEENKSFWCAFVDNSFKHPSWWPLDKAVPTYNQVIVSSKATDIGIHTDVYKPKKAEVHTYLSCHHGLKHVILLPPKETELFPEGGKTPFPLRPSKDLVQQIITAGGYYFDLGPSHDGPLTLYVPKSWRHWLLNDAEWSVMIGASRF